MVQRGYVIVRAPGKRGRRGITCVGVRAHKGHWWSCCAGPIHIGYWDALRMTMFSYNTSVILYIFLVAVMKTNGEGGKEEVEGRDGE